MKHCARIAKPAVRGEQLKAAAAMREGKNASLGQHGANTVPTGGEHAQEQRKAGSGGCCNGGKCINVTSLPPPLYIHSILSARSAPFRKFG